MTRSALTLTLALALVAAAAAAPDPAADTVKPRGLPDNIQEAPPYLEAKAASDTAQAKYDQLLRARPPYRGAYSRPVTPAEEKELGLIMRRMMALGWDPYPSKAIPPKENWEALNELRAQRDRILARPLTEAELKSVWPAYAEWESRLREAAEALDRPRRELELVERDLAAVRDSRRKGAAAVAVSLAEIAAEPDRFVGKPLRLYDVTLVSRSDETDAPTNGLQLTADGVLEVIREGQFATTGKWDRLEFLDLQGTKSPAVFIERAQGARPIEPGMTADVFCRLVKLKEGAAPLLLCEQLTPHGRLSGPPAPGFKAAEPGAPAGGDAGAGK